MVNITFTDVPEMQKIGKSLSGLQEAAATSNAEYRVQLLNLLGLFFKQQEEESELKWDLSQGQEKFTALSEILSVSRYTYTVFVLVDNTMVAR